MVDGKSVLLFAGTLGLLKGLMVKCLCGPSCAQAEPHGGQLLSHMLSMVAGCFQTSCIVQLSPAAAAAKLLLGSRMQGGVLPSQKLAAPPGSVQLEAGSLPGAVPRMLSWLRYT